MFEPDGLGGMNKKSVSEKPKGVTKLSPRQSSSNSINLLDNPLLCLEEMVQKNTSKATQNSQIIRYFD